ncbi:Ku protein [Streptomyces sp. NPDC096191]|uniref:Ku protein n=1 Tax=Streptomyces sp. NPDC096191 TaxID=3155426 RepID=UPI0033326FB4
MEWRDQLWSGQRADQRHRRDRGPLDPLSPGPPGGHGPGADAQIIPISDEDLRDLPLPTARAIEIVAFVPLASVDPIRIGAGYYLEPKEQVAAKPYKLLRQALERAGGRREVRLVRAGASGAAPGARGGDRAARDALAGRDP